MLKKTKVTISITSSHLQIASLDLSLGNVKYAGHEFNSTSNKLNFIYCKNKNKGQKIKNTIF